MWQFFANHRGPKWQFYAAKSSVIMTFAYCDHFLLSQQCRNNRKGMWWVKITASNNCFFFVHFCPVADCMQTPFCTVTPSLFAENLGRVNTFIQGRPTRFWLFRRLGETHATSARFWKTISNLIWSRLPTPFSIRSSSPSWVCSSRKINTNRESGRVILARLI